MRITAVQHSPSRKAPSFGTGHTSFYTDFDGTYFPYSQNAIAYEGENFAYRNVFNEMQMGFAKMIKNAQDNFHFAISTGRGKSSLECALNIIKDNRLIFCMPDECILRDGLARYAPEREDSRIVLKSLSNDGTSDFETPKKAIKRTDPAITIIEALSNEYLKGHERECLEKKFLSLPSKKRMRYASIAAEDNGFTQISFPNTVDIKPFARKLETFYPKDLYTIIPVEKDKNMYVPHQKPKSDNYEYLPSNSIYIKPKVEGKVSNKLDIPKNEARKIVENDSNDLVIVAGDGPNDKDMLNPVNYLDIFGIKKGYSESLESFFNRKDVLEATKKLPVVFIVAGEDECLSEITQIKDILEKNDIHKIFNTTNPRKELLDKVKLGMLYHCGENEEYKYGLGYDLYMDVLG